MFDAGHASQHPCLGCDACGMSRPCVQKDDMVWLREKLLKTVLIAAARDGNRWTMTDRKAHYETLCRYLNFENMGEILGTGCGTVSMTKRTKFPKEAYGFGKRIGG